MATSTTLRSAIIVGLFTLLCIAGMEFLAVNIGQGTPFSSDYTIHAAFSDADGLPTSADVRVSGVDVGKVLSVSHDPSLPGETVVTLAITDSKAVPVYSDGYAMVRPKTLLGEKYVDLTVGDPASSEAIASGGFLPLAQAGKDVSNDEIFNAFDAPTRAEQQQVIQELDAATFQRSGDIQSILPQLTQVVSNLQPIANLYEKDQPQVDDIFVQLNTVMATLADEHQQLGGLLANGNIALTAIAQKDQALITALQAAASFSSELNSAVAPTVAADRLAIADLGPALQSQVSLLSEIGLPQAACGGKPCGLDELLSGTLLGNVNYPNNQLTVSSSIGELVTDEWDAMFSTPTTDFRGLGFVFSPHLCPTSQSVCP